MRRPDVPEVLTHLESMSSSTCPRMSLLMTRDEQVQSHHRRLRSFSGYEASSAANVPMTYIRRGQWVINTSSVF